LFFVITVIKSEEFSENVKKIGSFWGSKQINDCKLKN